MVAKRKNPEPGWRFASDEQRLFEQKLGPQIQAFSCSRRTAFHPRPTLLEPRFGRGDVEVTVEVTDARNVTSRIVLGALNGSRKIKCAREPRTVGVVILRSPSTPARLR